MTPGQMTLTRTTVHRAPRPQPRAQADDRMLRHRRTARPWGTAAGRRATPCSRCDRPLPDHDRVRGQHAVHDAAQIHVDGAVPVRGGELRDQPADTDAGVVEDEVEATELRAARSITSCTDARSVTSRVAEEIRRRGAATAASASAASLAPVSSMSASTVTAGGSARPRWLCRCRTRRPSPRRSCRRSGTRGSWLKAIGRSSTDPVVWALVSSMQRSSGVGRRRGMDAGLRIRQRATGGVGRRRGRGPADGGRVRAPRKACRDRGTAWFAGLGARRGD